MTITPDETGVYQISADNLTSGAFINISCDGKNGKLYQYTADKAVTRLKITAGTSATITKSQSNNVPNIEIIRLA